MKTWFASMVGRRMVTFILTAVLTPVLLNLGVPPETVNMIIAATTALILGVSASDAARNWGVTTPPPSETPK